MVDIFNEDCDNAYSLYSIGMLGDMVHQLCSDSTVSEYVPYFAIFSSISHTVKGDNLRVRYGIPYTPTGTESALPFGMMRWEVSNLSRSQPTVRTYASAFRALETSTFPVRLNTNKNSDNPFAIYIMKGLIFSVGVNSKVNILFCIAIKNKDLKGLNRGNLKTKEKYVFMSNELMDNVKYKLFYNRLKSQVILPNLVNGHDIILTNTIEDKCFKEVKINTKFKTLSERKEFFNSIKKKLNGKELTG